jgi:hypothetical protein
MGLMTQARQVANMTAEVALPLMGNNSASAQERQAGNIGASAAPSMAVLACKKNI